MHLNVKKSEIDEKQLIQAKFRKKIKKLFS